MSLFEGEETEAQRGGNLFGVNTATEWCHQKLNARAFTLFRFYFLKYYSVEVAFYPFGSQF